MKLFRPTQVDDEEHETSHTPRHAELIVIGMASRTMPWQAMRNLRRDWNIGPKRRQTYVKP
eukprot:7669965-Pyramimonas_sp.AAC.1